MTDETIKEYLKSNEDRSLLKLYDFYKNDFVHYIRRYGLSHDQILDIYQDAFIALRENARKGKLDVLGSSVKTYFFAIGKYMAFHQMKEDKKLLVVDSLDEFDFSDYFIESDLDELRESSIRNIQSAMAHLGGKCKELLTLFYYEERKLDEIVELMKYQNKDVAKSQKSRCIKSLKELVKYNAQ